LPPQPAGCVTATPLLLLLSKNTLRFFLNPPRRTKPKEAAYAVTVLNSIVSSIILKNAFYNFIKRFKKIQKNKIQIQIAKEISYQYSKPQFCYYRGKCKQ